METLTKILYLTIMSVAVIMCVLFLLLLIPVLSDTWNRDPYGQPVDEEKALANIRGDPAYIAMYERYPDAAERVRNEFNQMEMEVGVMNQETGNQLILRGYAHTDIVYTMTVACHDVTGEHEDYVDDLFAAEYIRTTDCVSAP